MAKKGAKKSSSSENTERKRSVERMLVENFTSLQSVMADLAGKLNNLANQMSKLLELFEQSAKTFMEKDMKFAGGADKDLIPKLDRLLEQNKIIAQGITMLHEEHAVMPESNAPSAGPMTPFTSQANNQENANRYQRSISAKQDGKVQKPNPTQPVSG